MARRRISVNTFPFADHYAASSERIIEYVDT
jgi:hypothetical protein